MDWLIHGLIDWTILFLMWLNYIYWSNKWLLMYWLIYLFIVQPNTCSPLCRRSVVKLHVQFKKKPWLKKTVGVQLLSFITISYYVRVSFQEQFCLFVLVYYRTHDCWLLHNVWSLAEELFMLHIVLIYHNMLLSASLLQSCITFLNISQRAFTYTFYLSEGEIVPAFFTGIDNISHLVLSV